MMAKSNQSRALVRVESVSSKFRIMQPVAIRYARMRPRKKTSAFCGMQYHGEWLARRNTGYTYRVNILFSSVWLEECTHMVL